MLGSVLLGCPLLVGPVPSLHLPCLVGSPPVARLGGGGVLGSLEVLLAPLWLDRSRETSGPIGSRWSCASPRGIGTSTPSAWGQRVSSAPNLCGCLLLLLLLCFVWAVSCGGTRYCNDLVGGLVGWSAPPLPVAVSTKVWMGKMVHSGDWIGGVVPPWRIREGGRGERGHQGGRMRGLAC